MVKLLFCGDVNDSWDLLAKRVNDLQTSSHGPFHALFIVGKCSSEKAASVVLPMKTYVFDRSFKNQSESDIEIVENDAGIITAIDNLTVAYFGANASESGSEYDYVKKIASSATYRGCDILITSEWPRDMHHFMESSEYNELQSLNIIGSSKAVNSIATLVKPRYHFVHGKGCFFQRSPYRNSPNSDGQSCAFSRLISIDKVSDTKDKSHKWMHALSFNPIVNMSAAELAEEPAGTTDCPYVSIGEKRTVGNAFSTDNNPAKKSRVDSNSNLVGGTGAFFFGDAAGNSSGNTNNAALNLEAPNSTISTLFIGGLSRDVSDYDLKNALPNATFVKRPPGKSFAFVEFGSHAAAKKVVDSAGRQGGVVVKGRTLTVGWGKERDNHNSKNNEKSNDTENSIGFVHERQLVPPTSDSRTLFVGGLPTSLDSHVLKSQDDSGDSVLSELDKALLALFENSVKIFKIPGKVYAFVEFDTYDNAMAIVTKSINENYKLEGRMLTVGWAKGELISSSLNHQQTRAILTAAPSEDSNVLFLGNIPPSAKDNEISALISNNKKIQYIRRPGGKDFAFIEFNAATDAQESMNALSSQDIYLHNAKLVVGWAKGKAADRLEQSADCWFCLASPVVKVHLVVSVGEHSYIALPRGGLNDNHVMISPIDCVPSRVHLSTDGKSELIRFQDSLDKLHKTLGMTAVRFERTLRTKGGRDHMQVHVVPLENKFIKSAKAIGIFTQKFNELGLKFHEIVDSRSVDEVVVSMEGGPYQEYFYIEIPTGDATNRFKRYVYVHEEDSPRFPMQFGVELVAEIMGQPERSHWKNCLVSESEEKRMAEEFRDKFTPYDFTL